MSDTGARQRCEFCGRFLAYDDAWVVPSADGEFEFIACPACVGEPAA